MAAPSSPGPRERLLEAADRLFYRDGIHTVGIDRILEEAGVAKASLYSTFGSKDALIGEYLSQRLARRQERVERAIARHESPRDRILAVFDVLIERAAEKDIRGCAFYRAAAEGEPDEQVSSVLDAARLWLRMLFIGLAQAFGAKDADRLARQLVILYDGALVMAQMESDAQGPKEARAVAEMLIDASEKS